MARRSSRLICQLCLIQKLIEMIRSVQAVLWIMVITISCKQRSGDTETSTALNYCLAQAGKTLKTLPADSAMIPRSIANGKTGWRFVNYRDWTCGFWPGILWYMYEYSHDNTWKQ